MTPALARRRRLARWQLLPCSEVLCSAVQCSAETLMAVDRDGATISSVIAPLAEAAVDVEAALVIVVAAECSRSYYRSTSVQSTTEKRLYFVLRIGGP